MLTRRDFLARFGGLTAATAAVCALPQVLGSQGWWSPAYALDADLVLDTYNGLAAMVWPGHDAYSVAQGEWNRKPGAIAANAGRHVMDALDGIVPQPASALRSGGETMPLSHSVASAINTVAVSVNPLAKGVFPSPFARLPFADKAAVWRTLEQDTRRISDRDPTHSVGLLQSVFGVLPALVAFYGFSEVDVFDPATRTLSRRPVGWDHCGYLPGRTGPVEGWDDLLGYYQDRREVEG
ncbi:MAG TPA: hypothetical protein VJS45_07200 [Acidimicrobiia bacterium]|nr:hypothetical protein [Acidimicrobiia bacterium]